MSVELSMTAHGITQFRERVRPDLTLEECPAVMRELANTELVGYRQSRQRPDTWYLRCGMTQPFTMVTVPVEKIAGPIWRVITVVHGHEHY